MPFLVKRGETLAKAADLGGSGLLPFVCSGDFVLVSEGGVGGRGLSSWACPAAVRDIEVDLPFESGCAVCVPDGGLIVLPFCCGCC